ncbi:MAG TPA: dihydroneopterin aldolase [Actinomycetota bacterium]|nr:dihydroneopterin aldolase [Actinomycetota bacterium]
MSTSRLFLTGIDVEGRHGANAGEKDRPQAFVVDLDVEVAVSSDTLEGTADYRTLIRTAREVVQGTSFDLLESIATAVAEAVAARSGVVRATAIVHKPGAAISSGVQGVAAAATAEPTG